MTVFSQIQVVLSCILLAATIFWTCIKIAKALREFDGGGIRAIDGTLGYAGGYDG